MTVTADVEESSLEETAEQFAGYFKSEIKQLQIPTITVAVVPFECVGRFDQLWPPELGL